MKTTNRQNRPVVNPLLKELADLEKANSKRNQQNPSVESSAPNPPDLYQDPGGGFNPDLTFPQE